MATKKLHSFPAITDSTVDDLIHVNDGIQNQDRSAALQLVHDDLLNNNSRNPVFNTIRTNNFAFKFKKITGNSGTTGGAIPIEHGIGDATKIISVAMVSFHDDSTFDILNEGGTYAYSDDTYCYFNWSGSSGEEDNIDFSALIFYIE